MYYLNTFTPLAATSMGRNAVVSYGQPPFVDGSCRREPDFQNPFPSISALCRLRAFAPRLLPGHRVVYLAVKRAYFGIQPTHWRLVAALTVLRRFETHEQAAEWYESEGVPLPSNCIVPSNSPRPLHETHGLLPPEVRSRGSLEPEQAVRLWDVSYRARARGVGTFLVCQAEYLEVMNSPVVLESQMRAIFGYVPGTQTPPCISPQQFKALLALAQ
jgi:hypothetical protein